MPSGKIENEIWKCSPNVYTGEQCVKQEYRISTRHSPKNAHPDTILYFQCLYCPATSHWKKMIGKSSQWIQTSTTYAERSDGICSILPKSIQLSKQRGNWINGLWRILIFTSFNIVSFKSLLKYYTIESINSLSVLTCRPSKLFQPCLLASSPCCIPLAWALHDAIRSARKKIVNPGFVS